MRGTECVVVLKTASEFKFPAILRVFRFLRNDILSKISLVREFQESVKCPCL